MKQMALTREIIAKRTSTCGDTTSKEADFGEIGLGADFGDTGFVEDGVLAENGSAHEMEDGLPIRHS